MEIKILVDGKAIRYNGLFRLQELYALIRRYFRERGYYMIEKVNDEQILENGKQVLVEMEPQKKYSHYAQGRIKTKVFIKGLKEKTVTIDGQRQKWEQGDVEITFYSYHDTDYRGKWEGAGWQYLLRTLMNKFIKRDFTYEIEQQTIKDTNDLGDEIKSYLNMSHFKFEDNRNRVKKSVTE